MRPRPCPGCRVFDPEANADAAACPIRGKCRSPIAGCGRWFGGGRTAAAPLRHLDRADGDLAGARIVLGIELHLLAFAQAVDACPLERGGVDENVPLAVVRLNEAEALLVIVELNGARSHGYFLSLTVCPWDLA